MIDIVSPPHGPPFDPACEASKVCCLLGRGLCPNSLCKGADTMKYQRALMIALSICCAALLTADARAQGWGSVEGQFVIDGQVPNVPPLVAQGAAVKDAEVCAAKDVPDDSLVVDPESKGIANIFVYLRKAPAQIHPQLKAAPKDAAVFDQKNCRFIPHSLLVRTGQTVLVKSSDPILHNTHTHPLRNDEENMSVTPNNQQGIPLDFKQPEPLPTKVNCDLHPHMIAYWLVLDHPYMAVTDEQGRFKIENLPEGEHVFTVWQERVGYINREFKVTVKKGQTTKLEPVKVPAAKLAGRAAGKA
jgi:hypothetical protein